MKKSWINTLGVKQTLRKVFAEDCKYMSPRAKERELAGLPPIKEAWAEVVQRSKISPMTSLICDFDEFVNLSDDEVLPEPKQKASIERNAKWSK
jgi:hypothetical protein